MPFSAGPRRTVHVVPVCDFTDGLDLDQVLLVRSVDALPRRDGREGVKVVLGDRSGSVPAMLWDTVADVAALLVPGRPVRVMGRYAVHPRHGAQITVRALRAAAPGSFDLTALCDGPARPAEALIAALRALVASIRDPHLQALLQRILGEDALAWPGYRDAPAAKHYHHAYRHGLLEHSLTVAEGAGAMSTTFGGIDRDIAVTGALLHDIGKLEAYTHDPLAIRMTDAGRLIGEIPLGYFRVRQFIESVPGFPEAKAQALLHIILSHHGTLQHGSPVVPATREATLVHFLDNLGGRLGSFDRLEKTLTPGEEWSRFDRALGGAAYFGAPAGAADAGAGDLADLAAALADLPPARAAA
jgi:3'-5' exoribonuclease